MLIMTIKNFEAGLNFKNHRISVVNACPVKGKIRKRVKKGVAYYYVKFYM